VFLSIPPTATLAHYEQIKPGIYAVVTPAHKVLASSFYDLRHQYTASATINGAGCWVILLPIPQPTQASLF
jgi:hypothetical protein